MPPLPLTVQAGQNISDMNYLSISVVWIRRLTRYLPPHLLTVPAGWTRRTLSSPGPQIYRAEFASAGAHSLTLKPWRWKKQKHADDSQYSKPNIADKENETESLGPNVFECMCCCTQVFVTRRDAHKYSLLLLKKRNEMFTSPCVSLKVCDHYVLHNWNYTI